MSVSTRTISVTNDAAGENVSVVVPSELSANEWRNLLNETGDYDPAADSSNGAYVYRVADRTAGVELYFESGATYQLKLSKVGVGRGVGGTGPAYLTSTEDLTENPFVDRTYPFVVEARDKYNNPIGTDVTAAAERGTVPDGGRYRYQYSASSVGRDWVNVTYVQGSGESVYQTGSQDFNGELRENVQYDVNVQAGGVGGGGNSPTTFNSLTTSNPSQNKYAVTFDVEDPDGIDRVEFSLRDASDTELDSNTKSGYGTTAQDQSDELNEAPDTADYIRVTVVDDKGNRESKDADV